MRITPSKEEVTGTIFGLTRAWFWLAMIVATVFVVGTGYWIAKPYWLGLERQAYVSSHQYVEARRTSLVTLLTQAQSIDTSLANPALSETLKSSLRLQKAGLIQRIRTAQSEIPADAVPSAVIRYLAMNGG